VGNGYRKEFQIEIIWFYCFLPENLKPTVETVGKVGNSNIHNLQFQLWEMAIEKNFKLK
jgi:hypothetical protein